MAKQVSASLRDAREMLGTVGKNIDNTQQPGARSLDTSIKISPVGKNGAYRTSVVTTRRDDPLKTKVLFSSTSSASKTQTKSVSLSFLQEAIGTATGLQKSVLVDRVGDFIAQSKYLPAIGDVSMKKAFVAKGVALADALNNATDKVNNLRLDADTDLKNGLVSLNTSLKQLYLLNQNIAISRSPQNLYDNRDRLIGEISQKLEVQAYYGHNGIANLMIKGSRHELVSATSRAEFSYAGTKSSELLTGGKIPEITITKVATEGGRDRIVSSPTAIVGGTDNPSLQGMKGGQIEGWINLRDVELPLAGDAVKSLAAAVAKAVNGVHNNGSPYPPKTSFRGSKPVFASQELDFKGKVTFFSINKDGKQLVGGAGKLNPATIDFDLFKGRGFSVKPTTFELVKEINERLSATPSKNRVAIGAISSNGAQVDGQYLINNMQLAGMSDIGTDGRWTFDLDLQGNAYFGSKVEVLSVIRDPGLGNANQPQEGALPEVFDLGKSVDARTNKPITLGGFVRGGGPVNVAVQVRVTGENGVVETGTVTFAVDQDTPKFNERIAYQAGGAVPVPVQFNTTGLSHTGVARAKLVDDNNNEITDPNSTKEGHLVIQTNSDEYRLAIQNGDLKNNSMQSGNFSSLLGLNNFFDFDEATGKISVSKAISDDPRELATGMVTLNKETEDTTVRVGDQAARSSLAFGVDFAVGDSINVDGQNFVFGPGLGQVPIGGNVTASLQNLKAAMDLNPALRFSVEPLAAAATSIMFVAKTKGSSGALPVIVTLAAQGGAQTLAINSMPRVFADGVAENTNFVGGTDKDGTIKIADYSIGDNSLEVFANMQKLSSEVLEFTGLGSASGEFSKTIEEFATLVSGAITGQYNEAKAIDDVKQGALDSLNKELTKLFSPDLYEQYFYSLELKQYMTVVANYGKMVQNIADRIFDTLFGRN
jgi:flagellar hook-associated protein 1 FlgK